MSDPLHTCRTNSECDDRLKGELDALYRPDEDGWSPLKTLPQLRVEAAIFAAHGYEDFGDHLVGLADLRDEVPA